MNETKHVIIFGGGPAGLAASWELTKQGVPALVLEKDSLVGGICKTIQYRGFYFDCGGHRFFTKSDEVNQLWHEILGDDFLKRPRLSRIYYNSKFFYYPLRPWNALIGVGPLQSARVLVSYLQSRLFPYAEEETLEQWVSNHFGKRLFEMFFKTYTEKVWGVPCSEIQAEWSAQRIKGLSLTTAILNAFFKQNHNQIKTLIDEFHYPRFGPGMLYDRMKQLIAERGNRVWTGAVVSRVHHSNGRVQSVNVSLPSTQTEETIDGTDFISSIPINELVEKMHPPAPAAVLEAARQLRYRCLLTVNLVLDRENLFPDNWLYIHTPGLRVGRIQNFKNWSPHMVPDPSKTSLGLEYFCDEDEAFFNAEDNFLIDWGTRELEQLRLARSKEVIDAMVIRVPKAYPVYLRGYQRPLQQIKDYLSQFSNLQPVGRYGMYKYNNQDHSILTGLYAARNILGAKLDVWSVNTERDYHEMLDRSKATVTPQTATFQEGQAVEL